MSYNHNVWNRIREFYNVQYVFDKNNPEIQLWKFLASNQRTMIGGSKTSCTSGVPQGSTISPMHFDTYTEPVL
jgi:hypothetical protein